MVSPTTALCDLCQDEFVLGDNVTAAAQAHLHTQKHQDALKGVFAFQTTNRPERCLSMVVQAVDLGTFPDNPSFFFDDVLLEIECFVAAVAEQTEMFDANQGNLLE